MPTLQEPHGYATLPNNKPIKELTDKELVAQSFAINQRIEDYRKKLDDPRWRQKARRGIRETLSGNVLNHELLELQNNLEAEMKSRKIGV